MKRVLVLNPKDKSEIKKFESSGIDLSKILDKSKSEYTNSNQLYRVLYTLEDGHVSDYCVLELTRDLRTSVLTYPTMDQAKRTRILIDEAISVAEYVDSENILFTINKEDNRMRKIMENREDFSCFPIESNDKTISFIYEDVKKLGSYGK